VTHIWGPPRRNHCRSERFVSIPFPMEGRVDVIRIYSKHRLLSWQWKRSRVFRRLTYAQDGLRYHFFIGDKIFHDLKHYDFKHYVHYDNKKELYPNNINKAFDNYIKEVIEYFKILDETDLFQEDYIGLQILDEMELEEEEEEKVEKINDEEIIKTFMLPKNNVPNLDNFVKIKKTQEEKIVKLPVQKEINLCDNQYKTKGIKY
jgi:hypothetical protein